MKFNGASYESDEFNLEKDNYYTFLIDNPQSWKEKLYFLFNDVEGSRVKKVSVFVFYVLFDGNEVEFNIKCGKNMWGLSIENLSYYEQPSKIEIYLKCIETTENVCGQVSIQT